MTKRLLFVASRVATVFLRRKMRFSRIRSVVCCCIKFWSLLKRTDIFNIFQQQSEEIMAQSSIHHRQNALWRGLWMLFSCDWTIACTPGKFSPLRNEAWSTDPPKWYIDTLFFTWSAAITGLLECGILYFSTYSKLCKTQYTHITNMQHATVLFVLNNACLRPRNTGIITMSWPQKITSTSSVRVDSTCPTLPIGMHCSLQSLRKKNL